MMRVLGLIINNKVVMPYYMRLSLYVVVVGLFWTLSAVIIQNSGNEGLELEARVRVSVDEDKECVKKAFLHAYSGYRKYAWGSDELCSLTKVRSK